MAKLSPKEKAFCRALLTEKDQTAAAIKAGYSRKSARRQATRLSTKAHIQKEVVRLESKRERKDLMKADEVERELDRLIRFNLYEFVDSKTGDAKPIHELSPEQAACVKEMSTIETQLGTSRSIKFYDKLGAIRTKMQRLGMLVEKKEISGPGGAPLPIRVTFDFGNDTDGDDT